MITIDDLKWSVLRMSPLLCPPSVANPIWPGRIALSVGAGIDFLEHRISGQGPEDRVSQVGIAAWVVRIIH